jgi:hypothetical protein
MEVGIAHKVIDNVGLYVIYISLLLVRVCICLCVCVRVCVCVSVCLSVCVLRWCVKMLSRATVRQ